MKTTKPSACVGDNNKIQLIDGSTLDIYNDGRCTAAYLELPGHDHSLSLIVEKAGGSFLKYVGYRDGVCHEEDAVAIAVDDRGEVTIQVVIPNGKTHEIPLEKLRDLVAEHCK